MPTFGKTAIGASATAFEAEKESVCKYEPKVSGKISKLTVYIKDGATAGTVKMKAVIYKDEGGKPGALLAEGTEVTFVHGSGSKWVDLPLSAELAVPEGIVWIGLIFSNPTGVIELVWDTGAEKEHYFQSRTYASGAANPFVSGGFDTKEISLYATFTYNAPTVTKPTEQFSGQEAEALPVQISATNAEKYEATNLPKGLSLNASTGLITGTPTTREKPTVTIKVVGIEGSGTAETTFVWNVLRADGKKNIGSSSAAFEPENLRLFKKAFAAGGKIRKLVLYIGEGTNTGTLKMKPAVYADNAGKPGALLGEGAEVTYKHGEGNKWVELPFATEPEVSKGVVWIGVDLGGTANVGLFFFDVEEGHVHNWTPVTYGSALPNPYTAFGFNENSVSIYAVYSGSTPSITNPGAQVHTVGIPINELWLTGNNIETWEAPALPAGLSINATTGHISGTPTTVKAVTAITVKGKGEGVTAEVTFNWTIQSVAQAETVLGYTAFSPIPAPPGQADSPFNRLVGTSRILPNSAALVAWIFGSTGGNTSGVGKTHSRNQFPTVYAKNSDPQVEILKNEVTSEAASFFNKKVIRIPENAKVQSNGDKHLQIVLCPADCTALGLPEGTTCDLWHAGGTGDPDEVLHLEAGTPKKLKCDSCGKGNIKTSLCGPPGGWSVAAGYDLNAGVIRGPEMKAREINHALVMLIHDVKRATSVYPANHTDGENTEANSPSMGQRFFLEMTDTEIESAKLSPILTAVAKALAKYGCYLEDTGGTSISFRTENDAMYTYAGAGGYMARLDEELKIEPDSEGSLIDYKPLQPYLESRFRAVAPPPTVGLVVPTLTNPGAQSSPDSKSLTLNLVSTNVTKFTATNLPTGLLIDPVLGVISGTPTVDGTFEVSIVGTGNGTEVEVKFTWTIISTKPTTGATGNAIYEAVSPLAYEDHGLGYPLLKFCDSLGVMWDDIDKIIRDKITPAGLRIPGYSSVLNLPECPTEWLPWLAQFTGTQAPPGNAPLDRELITGAEGMHRGTVESVENKVKLFLTGKRKVSIFERFEGKAYKLLVVVFKAETPVAVTTEIIKKAVEEVCPAGMIVTVVIAESWIYNELPGAETTYKKAHEDYKTYKGLANHQIGK